MEKAAVGLIRPTFDAKPKRIGRGMAAGLLLCKYNGRDKVSRTTINGARVYCIERHGLPMILVAVGLSDRDFGE